MYDLNLGITGFSASLHKVDECELNGLPRLPYSVNIIGRFEQFKSINHINLCCHLDAKRDKHERIVIATEYFPDSWESKPPDLSFMKLESFVDQIASLASALDYLHSFGIIMRTLSPKNVYWINNSDVKIVNYALYNITDCGKEVDFPIGNLRYLAPEAIVEIAEKGEEVLSCARSDVWALGMMILEILIGRKLDSEIGEFVKMILASVLDDSESVFKRHESEIVYQNDLVSLVEQCLQPRLSDRISMSDFRNYLRDKFPNSSSKCVLDTDLYESQMDAILSHQPTERNGHKKLFHNTVFQSVEEKYFFWTVTGGNLWKSFQILCDARDKLPPILTMPLLIRRGSDTFWSSARSNNSNNCVSSALSQCFFDDVLPLYQSSGLLQKMEKLKREFWSRDLRMGLTGHFDPMQLDKIEFDRITSLDELEMRKQPVTVKETDMCYQLRRVALFQRLIRGWPLTRAMLMEESSHDMPPLLRARLWPLMLLDDGGDSAQSRYSPPSTVGGGGLGERASGQIAVDLPRCHSYDQVIVSPSGQVRLGRVLTAWLIAQPRLEYTQGMDSLAAVFTRLLYGREAVAFACLEAFVDKFMAGLFCSSHGAALNEYCLVLQQLLAFHEPRLSVAVSIFSITGFTASWIYTGFAHSLPLEKTIRLWDTVILGESSFLMMVFIALLCQLDQEAAFCDQAAEHVFSTLSNLPQFDLDACRTRAIDLARRTPASATVRSFSNLDTVATEPAPAADFVALCQSQTSPFISLEDLLCAMGEPYNPSDLGGPFRFDPTLLSPVLIVDIRSAQAFGRGCLPGSVSWPLAGIDSPAAPDLLTTGRPGLKVIVDDESVVQCQRLARHLVTEHMCQYVCVLHGGMHEVRARRPDLLVVGMSDPICV